LHPSISVPLGLWPVVLAKAASTHSVCAKNCGHNKRKPWDGIYYMVKELVAGGKLKLRDFEDSSKATKHAVQNSKEEVAVFVTPQNKHRRLS
jgi:hypothetical protein